MPKCQLDKCPNDALKPTSTAFERLEVPNVYAYHPRLTDKRHYMTRDTIKYFCGPKCLAEYVKQQGVL